MTERRSGGEGNALAGSLVYSSDLLPATRRYFVLDKAARSLRYYKDELDASLPTAQHLGEFDLKCVNQVEDLKGSKACQLCFALHYYGVKHVLQAHSFTEMEDWISALKQCSKISVLKSETNPKRQSIEGSYRTEVVGDGVIKIPMPILEAPSAAHAWHHQAPADAHRSSFEKPARSSNHSDRGSATEHEHAPKAAIIRAGYCVKQGIVIKSWKRRYFVLDQENLKYYENDSCKKLKGAIVISSVSDCRASDGSIPNKDNLFEVVTTDRTFLIQTDTPEEMASWIDSIRFLLRLPPLTYL